MPSEQFSQAVRGSGGQPIATSAIGSIDTNDYGSGGGYDEDGSAYPYTLNPAETIKELGIQTVDAEVLVTITTVRGDVVEIPVASPSTYDRWDVDVVKISDPNGNAPRIAYWWAGE